VVAVALAAACAVNASTSWGIRPVWVKGRVDDRTDLALELWNPSSTVQARGPHRFPAEMWGGSPRGPYVEIDAMRIEIDHGASTPLMPWRGNAADFAFLRFDVTSAGILLKHGGKAAVVGVGGGRDVLAAVTNGFERVVGIEVNESIVDLAMRRLDAFSGFSRIPGFELHVDEGRSFLARTDERFDLIQVSMVDTWAATAAGALALSENGLYTVEGWEVFLRALAPGGILCVARWDVGADAYETTRMSAIARAALLRAGVARPADHVLVITSGRVATLLLGTRPFSAKEKDYVRELARIMEWRVIVDPDRDPGSDALARIARAATVEELGTLRDASGFDCSPVFDASPFFFNPIRLRDLPRVVAAHPEAGALRALAFLLGFAAVTAVLVVVAIVWPLRRSGRPPPAAGLVYFVALGLGFMLAEIGFVQQLSLFLGRPIYSLVVVLAGLILATGVGSLASDRARGTSVWAVVAALALVLASIVAPLAAARWAGSPLVVRGGVAFAILAPCGFFMGFCFPKGLARMKELGHGESLAWMWGLNGAASVLATPLALLLAMETSTRVCVLTGAACYVVGAWRLARLAPRSP
jgi:spermidine synthase